MGMHGIFLSDELDFEVFEEDDELMTATEDNLINPEGTSVPIEQIVPGAMFVYAWANDWFGSFFMNREGLFEPELGRKTIVNGKTYTILSVHDKAPANTPSNPVLYTLLLEPEGSMAWYRFDPQRWNRA